MSTALNRDLNMLMIQFLEEEKFTDALHRLERESGVFFNIKYFEESIMNGEWDKLEKYLLGFTEIEDNRNSMKIFYEIRKQKYLEALDKDDHSSAIKILREDLKVLSTFNEDLLQQLTALLSLKNFRENEILSGYGDEKTSREKLGVELKRLIEANPVFNNKLQFPATNPSRLRILINQSLNWQHQFCKSPKPNPDIKTLLVDHICVQSCSNSISCINPLIRSIPRPFQVMSNLSAAPFQVISAGPSIVAANNAVSMRKRPRTPPTNNPVMDYQTSDSEHVLKRSSFFVLSEEHGEGRVLPKIKVRSRDEQVKSNVWKLNELEEPSQLRSLKLTDDLVLIRIHKLAFTNSAQAILALTSSGVHKLLEMVYKCGKCGYIASVIVTF